MYPSCVKPFAPVFQFIASMLSLFGRGLKGTWQLNEAHTDVIDVEPRASEILQVEGGFKFWLCFEPPPALPARSLPNQQ
jgi:hypothetical protein